MFGARVLPGSAISSDGAPQISEAGADQYIGWLDGGAGAHMRAEGGPERSNVWRIETSDTERVPWFDTAYHDVFVLQGAGYPGRYNSGQDARTHGMTSDDYITTEVMTGHPPWCGMPSAATRSASIGCCTTSCAGWRCAGWRTFAFAGNNLHRQEIRLGQRRPRVGEPGRRKTGAAEGHALPQYGFYARIPGQVVEAAIERRDGSIVEWAKSPSMFYVNARPVVPEPQAGRGGGRSEPGPDPRLPRMNPAGRVLTFGAVSTNGGFRLTHARDSLELTPLPNSPSFTVRSAGANCLGKFASRRKRKPLMKAAGFSAEWLSKRLRAGFN